jgi:hypothetical protein
MTSYQRNRDETKPRRRRDLQIVIALFAGTLLTLLIVFILFGRSLLSVSAPPPTPTLAPTPTIITSSTVVQQIQRFSRLETSSYSVQSVVSAERPGGLLGIGRQKVLIIVHGTVIAGIDLSKLRPEDVTVSPDGKQVKVRLPEVEILSRYLDEEATQLYDHQTGLFTQPDSSLVIEAQQMGMSRVMQAACEGGIMKRATDDGQKALSEFLRAVGFEVIQFEDTPIPPCPEDV